MLEGLFWAAAMMSVADAMPLVGGWVEAVCEIHGWPCSRSDAARSTVRNERDSGSRLYDRSLAGRQDSSVGASGGPKLGTILGGVFGAIGGLAIICAIFYAWWSIRRVRQRHANANPDSGASSSFGPVTHLSKDSRVSRGRSNRSNRTYKGGPKWQDPWLAPPPKPARPAKLDVGSAGPKSKASPQDDRGSDSSTLPLKVIYTHAGEDGSKVVR